MTKRKIIAHLSLGEAEAVQEAIMQRLNCLYNEESKETMIDMYEEVKDSIRALDELGYMFQAGYMAHEYEKLTGVKV